MHAFWLMVGNEYTIRTLSSALTEVCSFVLYKFINTKWKVKKIMGLRHLILCKFVQFQDI